MAAQPTVYHLHASLDSIPRRDHPQSLTDQNFVAWERHGAPLDTASGAPSSLSQAYIRSESVTPHHTMQISMYASFALSVHCSEVNLVV